MLEAVRQQGLSLEFASQQLRSNAKVGREAEHWGSDLWKSNWAKCK